MSEITAKNRAEELYEALKEDFEDKLENINVDGLAFDVPSKDSNPLYEKVKSFNISELTEGSPGGEGYFDKIMKSNRTHLREEFDEGRISGDQYAKAYVELTTSALASGVQLIVSKEQALWQNRLIQAQAQMMEYQAIQAAVSIQMAKAQLIISQYQALGASAQVALAKMQLANEEVRFDVGREELSQLEYRGEFMLPAELSGMQTQTKLTKAQTSLAESQKLLTDEQLQGVIADSLIKEESLKQAVFTTIQLLPAQLDQQLEQNRLLEVQTNTADYNLRQYLPVQIEGARAQTNLVEEQAKQASVTTLEILPQQVKSAIADTGIKEYQLEYQLPAQLKLVEEQTEAKHAETSDTRLDGNTAVSGMVGKQKDLYTQQITSYKQDMSYKVTKLYSDSWIAQKTLDEGLLAPSEYTNVEIDQVLAAMRAEVGLPT